MVSGNISINTLVKSALLCFDENTKVQITNGTTISANQLCKGDKILSKENDEKFYDDVVNCEILEGDFPAHKFKFSNGKSITVTSNHLMIIFTENHFEMVPAKEIQINDVMCFKYGISTILEITESTLDKKVHVNTKSGLFYANELLTTGLCENLPKNLPDSAKNVVKKHMNNYLLENMEFPDSITLNIDQKQHFTISLKDCYC
jgi:hypothetical protein